VTAIADVATRVAQIQQQISLVTTGRPSGTTVTAPVSTSTSATAVGGASFAQVYADAVAGTAAAPSAAAAKLNGDGVPVELAAYGNGRIPATALRTVGTTGTGCGHPPRRRWRT
jgi:D-alanyl-D-alanine carboxypeptidase